MKVEALTNDCPPGYYEGHYRYGPLQPIWWDGKKATLSRGTTAEADLTIYSHFLGPLTEATSLPNHGS